MRLFTMAHAWAADRFTFIQYPDIRPVAKRYREKTLSIPERITLAVIGLIVVVAGLFATLAGLYLLWALVP